jgi:hypothetical protein
MRIVIAVLVVVLCLSVALSAPAGKGGVLTPTEKGTVLSPTEVRVLPMPDLIVKQVAVSQGSGEFPAYTFNITVANIGTRVAGVTTTGIVHYSWARTDQPMTTGLVGEVATPSIAPGDETVVTITHPVALAKMYLFVTADLPTTENQLGAIRERKEGNNVLAVPLDTTASFPRTFK